MGNCLKSPGGANDDISLLRDSNTNNSNSVEQLQQPPTYVQVHILNYIGHVLDLTVQLYTWVGRGVILRP